MSATTITGTGTVAVEDYKSISWVGKTRAGIDITIEMTNAINLGDIDWTFADKGDTVSTVTFTACYTGNETTSVEPWDVTIADGQQSGTDEILLGAGVFSIGDTAIGATRGGGSFKVVRDFRRINADGDRGPVKGRIVCESAEATLTMNVLEFITRITDLYTAVSTGNSGSGGSGGSGGSDVT